MTADEPRQYPRRKDRPRYQLSHRSQQLDALRKRLKVQMRWQAQHDRTGPVPLARGMELIRKITIRLNATEMAWLLEHYRTRP